MRKAILIINIFAIVPFGFRENFASAISPKRSITIGSFSESSASASYLSRSCSSLPVVERSWSLESVSTGSISDDPMLSFWDNKNDLPIASPRPYYGRSVRELTQDPAACCQAIAQLAERGDEKK